MNDRDELLRLLSAMCDNQLSQEEDRRLQELLTDAEARQLYLQYVDMHARLISHSTAGGTNTLPGVDALAAMLGDTAQQAVLDHKKTQNPRKNRWKGARRLASYIAVAAATLAA